MTKDGVFVCGHDDEYISEIQSDQFLCDRHAWNGSPMSLTILMDRVNILSSIRILIDYHPGWEKDRPQELRRLAQMLSESKDRDKYLLEVYSQADANAVLSVPFENIVMWVGNRRRRHKPARQVVAENAAFCLKKGIKAISISRKEILAASSELQQLRDVGVTVFSCGWNDFNSLSEAEKKGIDIVTTMTLIPGGRYRNFLFEKRQRLFVLFRTLAGMWQKWLGEKQSLSTRRRVFLVGVFDMLHYGQFELFRRAKALSNGGPLIVAVQDDDYVLKYKPEARIVVPLQQRIEMISAIRWVDWVDVYTDVDEIVQEVGFDVFVIG